MKKIALLAVLFLASCAHHRDVRPGPDGVNYVIVKADEDEGQQNALSQARDYCEEFKKSPVILEEKQEYTGKVDEETYNTGKSVSKVLKAVGGTTAVFGGTNEKKLGHVGILGGIGTDAALGKGYTVQMKFKCQ